MSTISDAIAQLFGSSSSKYDHGELKIRANTLVIGDAVYPIANVSVISLEDLRRPIPAWVWIAGAIGLLLLMTQSLWSLLGAMLLTLAITWIMKTLAMRSAADYSLNVRMNGGNTAVVLNNDVDLLKTIALELYDVIELEKASNTTFNIDQRVLIDTMTGSTLALTGMHGDLVDQIPG